MQGAEELGEEEDGVVEPGGHGGLYGKRRIKGKEGRGLYYFKLVMYVGRGSGLR